MKIISCNVDNQRDKTKAILSFTKLTKPAAVCLQDCAQNMKDSHITAEYAPFTNKSKNNTTMAKKENSPDYISETDISITITIKIQNQTYSITNIYVRPQTPNELTTAHLENISKAIKQIGLSKAIVIGDTDASDTNWTPAINLWPELGGNSNSSGIKHYNQIKHTVEN